MEMYFDEENGFIFLDKFEGTLHILDEEEYSNMEIQVENLKSANSQLIEQLEQMKQANSKLTEQLEQSRNENSDVTSQLNQIEQKNNEILHEVMKISLQAVRVDEIVERSKAYWVGQGMWLALNINQKANLKEFVDNKTLKLYKELMKNAPILCSAVELAVQPYEFLDCEELPSLSDNQNQS